MGPVEQLLESWSRLRGWYPVTIAGKRYHCDPDHISFWSKFNRDGWEFQTIEILKKLIQPGAVYCDIGAWIGPTVLYAAGKCSQVYCLEPDRIAYMYLLKNLKLNHLENVLPFNLALSPGSGLCTMSSPRGKHGDSMTSLLFPEGENTTEVLCFDWQTWLGLIGNPKIDCLKMDIEGGEFALLPAMAEYLARYKPGLCLSLHPHLLPEDKRGEAMVAAMDSLKVYGHCYNDRWQEISMESLLCAPLDKQAGEYVFLQ